MNAQVVKECMPRPWMVSVRHNRNHYLQNNISWWWFCYSLKYPKSQEKKMCGGAIINKVVQKSQLSTSCLFSALFSLQRTVSAMRIGEPSAFGMTKWALLLRMIYKIRWWWQRWVIREVFSLSKLDDRWGGMTQNWDTSKRHDGRGPHQKSRLVHVLKSWIPPWD